METPIERPIHKKIVVVVLGVVTLIVLCFAAFYYVKVVVPKSKIAKQNDAYRASLLQNNPVALQNVFAEDVKNGVNDAYTKSSAYFVTHRFFDNGGNIYEIYDYVNNHPELAFLKEAEDIYPTIFKQIKDRTLPSEPVDRAIYAYCAYLEILEKHGYADIATLATIANKYADTAYFAKTISKGMSEKAAISRTHYEKRNIFKSLKYAGLVKENVVDVLDGKITSSDIPARDVLVGLNQYAAALRYLEALGADVSFSPKSAKEIFTFTMDYSRRYVPELSLFTSLLNASTLVILNTSDSGEIKAALYPILDLNTKNIKTSDTSIIHKIVNSRLEEKPKTISDTNLDIYSKRNILLLAHTVPDFKTWLMSNGWVEDDFK